jgi:ankyrin repeat protein/N-acetylneuraminic acid mutarotase
MKTTISPLNGASFDFAMLLCAALCLLAWPARAATNDVTSALQRGLFEEEANQNLGAAIQAYQTVANQFDKDRKLAATAIFRLGECYRKQGNTNDAATQYERILREFSDQPTLVTLSRQSLAGMGSVSPAPANSAISDSARQEQKRLLAEEIKLVEKQLEVQQMLKKDGRIGQDALWATQRDLLKLKQQLAALDSGVPFSTTASEKSAPAMSDTARQEQKRLLEEEIKLVEKQLENQQKQVQTGVVSPGELLPTQRDLLKLKRQIAALDAGLPVSITATETTAPAASTEADEVRRIQALIKDSPDLVNAPDQKGETLLQSAAAKGKLAVVKVLLENGAAVDGLQQPGLTPLHYASANGHKAIIDLLLSKGAKADAQNQSGVTPLHLAARKGYETVAKALLAAGAPVNAQTKGSSSSANEDLQYHINPGQTPLLLTANAGYSGMVELLLAKGADANAEDGEGQTVLSYAVQSRYQAVLQALLAAHANPNAGRISLPLATAAYQGDMAALKLLLANGADPNTNSQLRANVATRSGNYGLGYKFSPLFLAVSQRHAEAAKELLRCKADPNGPGVSGNPLLYEALADAPTLKVLLEGGADPNVRTSVDGRPMLLQVVMEKNQPAVELLLAHQADVNAAKSDGWTPLDEAARAGLKDIAELLLKGGANVIARYKDGETPLYQAVRAGQRELVELLLANKADPNERDNSGHTPLDLAKALAQSGQGQPPGSPQSLGIGVPAPMARPQPQAPGIPASTPAQESKPEAMADLLRRHGAVDDLPKVDRIMVQRRSTADSSTAFTKGAQDWSQFTLLDLIGMQYGFLAASPLDGGGDGYSLQAFFSRFSHLPFPDLAHLRIRRPGPDLKTWKEQVVDLRPVLESGDCSKDVRLEWGDVVEIPEADHPLNERWPGFSRTELANLKKCLTRQVEIVINGQATNIALAPPISILVSGVPGNPPREPSIVAHTPFWLQTVLLQSKLVLTSSDLSRVKVTRLDAASGQAREWVVDCSQANLSPDFWLRDGDKIEVPEKANSASAEEATTALPSAPGIALPSSGGVQVLPASGTPHAVEEGHLSIGGVLYSPKQHDSDLLDAGYHADRSVRKRTAESWEQRAGAELKGRGANTAVWTGADMIVFGGEGMGVSFDDGARYCLAEDTWAALPRKGAPSSRTGHAAVWTGKEMIIWGGFGGINGENVNHNDGARYNPSSDTWKPVTTKNAPAARFDCPAVWTGREMLVWGGFTDSRSRYHGAHADAHLNSGGRYDLSSDSWKTITTRGAPSKRWAHTLVWTGKETIVWGGGNATKALGDGGRYNPVRDSWRPVSTDGAPSPRLAHVAVWTGKEMIVWGGTTRETDEQSVYFENGARYNPETDTWRPISTIGAPKGRVSTFAVWTGTEMVIWGGVNDAQAGGVNDSNRYVATGARYNPATDTWTEMTVTGAPPARLTSGVWTGEGLLTFGGYNNTHLNDTWFYSPARTLYGYVKRGF